MYLRTLTGSLMMCPLGSLIVANVPLWPGGWGQGLLIGGEAERGIGWEQGDMGILCTFCSILL